MLASGSDDYTVMLWKLTPGTPRRGNLEAQQAIEPWRCVQCFREAKQNVLDVAWSADGKRLASCSIDNNIYIWNMSTNALEATLVGHNGPVKGLCWDPVGKYLASQGADKKLQIWHADTWKKDDAVTEPFANVSSPPQPPPCSSPPPPAAFFHTHSWGGHRDGRTVGLGRHREQSP